MFSLPGRRALLSICLLLPSCFLAACGGGDAPAPVVDEAPTAHAVAAAIHKNGTILVAMNGSDPEGHPLAYAVVTAPVHGGLGAVVGNTVPYGPSAGFTGQDSFTYRVTDGTSWSEAATVRIAVTNTAPVATPLGAQTCAKNGDVAIALAGTDLDGDALFYEVDPASAQGGTISTAATLATYVAPAGFVGIDGFSYRCSDGTTASAWTSVAVDVCNTAPVAAPVVAAVIENGSKAITLVATDADGDALLYSADLLSAQGGTVVVLGDVATYTAPAAYTGADSFAFRASDGDQTSPDAIVSITVTDGEPVAYDVTAHMFRNGGSTSCTMTATDPDGDALVYLVFLHPLHGTLGTVSGDTVVYTPDAGWAGTDEFTYVARDALQGSNAATCTITVENRLPVASDDSVNASKNATTTVSLVATDADGDALTYAVSPASAQGGTVTVAGNVASYRAPDGFEGADSFTFTANDGLADSAAATVSLLVANAAPVAQDATMSVHHETPTTVALVASDGDGDPLVYTVDLLSAEGGTISTAGTVATYTPPAGFAGTDSFHFSVHDGTSNSNLATVTIAVRDRLYVKHDATGTGDGSSWTNAFPDLQGALAAAGEGDSIWIAGGTYRPSATGDRNASFVLPAACRLYGGFAGTETELSQAAPETNVTTLSGDIGVPGDDGDNSLLILEGSDGCHVEGITVRQAASVGGMAFHLAGGEASLTNCCFEDNEVSASAANPVAAVRLESGKASLRDCRFRNNRTLGTSAYGGAIRAVSMEIDLHGCDFENNAAVHEGGAISLDACTSVLVEDCRFVGNTAYLGGACAARNCARPTIRNTVFAGNHSENVAALVLLGSTGGPNLVENCVFVQNTSAIYARDLYGTPSTLLRNCTLVGTDPASEKDSIWLPIGTLDVRGCIFAEVRTPVTGTATATVSHSLLPASHPGEGNLVGTPLFVDASDPDGGDDTWGTADDGLRMICISPGVDGADPADAPSTDLRGLTRDRGDGPDMGAYESGWNVLRVRKTATGAGDGSSWADAFPELRDALAASAKGDEIWVAAGTYKPTAGTDRSLSFAPKEGAALYGGFLGTETLREDRDPTANTTVLSGDIGTPGATADDSQTLMMATESLLVDGFTFTRGNADGTVQERSGSGGALFAENCSFRVARCRFEQNLAESGGALMFLRGGTSVFEDCRFSSNQAVAGGVFDVLSATSDPTVSMTFVDCRFESNEATTAGVGLAYGNCSASFTKGTFVDNHADNVGGVFWFQQTHALELDGCSFSGNEGTQGGVLRFTTGESLRVSNCSFQGNTAASAEGGAINVSTPTAGVEITNCTFANNSAVRGGGALICFSGDLLVEGCTFTENSVSGPTLYNGGGTIFCTNGVTLTLRDSHFTSNQGWKGSALSLFRVAGAQIDDCSFVGNGHADGSGGAIYHYDGGLLQARGCVFAGNSAGTGSGGALMSITNTDSCEDRLEDCLFVANAADSGSAIYAQASVTQTVRHCSFLHHEGGAVLECSASPVVQVLNSILWNPGRTEMTGGTFVVTYSCVEGGFSGLGSNNVDVDPLFVDDADRDGADDVYGTADDGLRLAVTSPLVDAANVADATTSDLLGTPRPVGDGPDMGCFETRPMRVLAAATGAGDGSSWTDAFPDLQQALAAHHGGDEIWCSQGSHLPTTESDRGATFTLTTGAALLGGFDGTETSRGDRNAAAKVTVLSGEIGDPGDTMDNSHHVLTVGSRVLVDGLTLRDASLSDDVFADGSGGGLRGVNAEGILVQDCRFLANLGRGRGAGLSLEGTGTVPNLVRNCLFQDNELAGSSATGGACYVDGVPLTIEDSRFVANRSIFGAALGANACTVTINRSSFTENEGAFILQFLGTIPTVECCLLGDNVQGSAVILAQGGNCYLRSSTVAHNEAGTAGLAAVRLIDCTLNVTGSILWANGDAPLSSSGMSFIGAMYNCIPGFGGSMMNIDTDPLFVNPSDVDGPDDVAGTADDGLRLDASAPSPCIDTGAPSGGPALDLTGGPRLLGAAMDMGAYELR